MLSPKSIAEKISENQKMAIEAACTWVEVNSGKNDKIGANLSMMIINGIKRTLKCPNKRTAGKREKGQRKRKIPKLVRTESANLLPFFP
jgi:hypothetical protein